MSPSEFEVAVGDRAAARHAYLDALQAALPACDAGKTKAADRSDYNDAARFAAIAKIMRAALAGFEKPRSKAEIKASLDGGIIAHIVQEWQREIDAAKSELDRRVQAAEEDAKRKTDQLLVQEEAAAANDDFALAKTKSEEREKSVRDGESAVSKIRTELQVCRITASPLVQPPPSHMLALCDDGMIAQARLSAIEERKPNPRKKSKDLEQRARAILSHTPAPAAQDSASLRALLLAAPSCSLRRHRLQSRGLRPCDNGNGGNQRVNAGSNLRLRQLCR
jgi:hypothetical protein